jgi:hypothetical protein
MIAEFVAGRGARLLDRKRPGWATLVRRRVNIRSGSDCILGQVYGSYARGADDFGFGKFASAFHGFFWLNPFTTVRTLNKAWQAEIGQRQAARVRSHVLAA